jgi:hypothetical protein
MKEVSEIAMFLIGGTDAVYLLRLMYPNIIIVDCTCICFDKVRVTPSIQWYADGMQ